MNPVSPTIEYPSDVILAELCAPPDDYIMAELVSHRPRKPPRGVFLAALLVGGLAVSTGILFAALQERSKQGFPVVLFVHGGHLTALLATDDSYLHAVGCSLADVRGAMPMSGVYSLSDKLFTKVFAADPAVRENASPRRRVQAGCPPFLIVYAAKDFPTCEQASEEFAKALRDQQVPADTLKIDDRNHINLITRTPDADDPCGRALLDFVAKYTSSADHDPAAGTDD